MVILESFGACDCNSKTTGRRAKLIKIWDSWSLIDHIRGTFGLGPCSVQCHFRVLQCICLKWPVTTRKPDCRVKRGEIWDSGVLLVEYTTICGNFDLKVFKVILGSLDSLLSKQPVTGKRLAIKRNRVKSVTRGVIIDYIGIPFIFYCLMRSGGHSVQLSQPGSYIKRFAIEENWLYFRTQGSY